MQQVAEFYSWRRVAERTVRVYDDVAASTRDDTTLARLRRVYKCVHHPWGYDMAPCMCFQNVLHSRIDALVMKQTVGTLFCAQVRPLVRQDLLLHSGN